MTTFGDLRNESPFAIACQEKGSGHWADVKNWVYEFESSFEAYRAYYDYLPKGNSAPNTRRNTGAPY